MGNFNIDSHFDKDANFNKIVIGSGSPVLECELNEMQDITNEQVRNMIRTVVGEGVEKLGTYNYTQGNFRLQNEKAVVDGLPIDITYLTIKANEGEKIFLKVWTETVTYADTIKYKGNAQSSQTVDNKILDTRIGEETSRRKQIKYNLTTSTDVTSVSDTHFLYLGQIKSGAFVFEANVIRKVTGDYVNIKATKVVNPINSVLQLTKDYYQVIQTPVKTGVVVKLPTDVKSSDFVQINLVFSVDMITSSSTGYVLFDEEIKWLEKPVPTLGYDYVVHLSHVEGKWYGEYEVYKSYSRRYLLLNGDLCVNGLGGGWVFEAMTYYGTVQAKYVDPFFNYGNLYGVANSTGLNRLSGDYGLKHTVKPESDSVVCMLCQDDGTNTLWCMGISVLRTKNLIDFSKYKSLYIETSFELPVLSSGEQTTFRGGEAVIGIGGFKCVEIRSNNDMYHLRDTQNLSKKIWFSSVVNKRLYKIDLTDINITEQLIFYMTNFHNWSTSAYEKAGEFGFRVFNVWLEE